MDRVAAAGAVVALVASLSLPFVVLRANRIVAGVLLPVWSAGVVGALLVAACAASAVVAVVPLRRRGAWVLASASACTVALAWALGTAAGRLLEGAPAFARVSIGLGAWLVVAGVAVQWFAGVHGEPGRWALSGAAVVALVGLVGAALLGGLGRLSIAVEYAQQGAAFWQYVGTHLAVAGTALGAAIVIGVPLGVVCTRAPRTRSVVLAVVGIIQTVPSLALLGLLIVPLAALGLPGIGPLPGIIALTLYALLPIVRNTYVGLAGVDDAIVDAGRGMGMSSGQLLLRVEAPLALPLVIEGVRSAAVLVIGIAAVVAFIGVGTLGVYVFEGFGFGVDDLIMLGAVPMVVLAIAADVALRLLARAAVSSGIRAGTS